MSRVEPRDLRDAAVAPRRRRAMTLLAAIGGALLFAWSIRRAGADAVFADVTRLGAGFALVLVLGGVRHLVRATAWRLCLDSPADLPFGVALSAYLAGDAIGNVTPFGALISEPSKIVLVRGRVAASTAVPALAIENLFYSATVVAMLVAGTAALLLVFPVPQAIRVASVVVLAATLVATALMIWIVATRRRVVSAVARRLGAQASHVRDVEDRVFDFAGRHPGRVWPIAALEIAYHTMAVFEIWFAVGLITGTPPSLLTAFVLEYVNRAITVAFQFVPLWLGVDEAGTGVMAAALGIGPAAGVSLALARKARILIWTGVGLVLLARDGVRSRRNVRNISAAPGVQS